MEDPGLRRRLGEEAREFALKNFSLTKILEREYQLYAKLIGSDV